jgi:hypothetical protein
MIQMNRSRREANDCADADGDADTSTPIPRILAERGTPFWIKENLTVL